ncbi:hypothetical protein FVEN_g5124 [Fusarium venenatum]|uniref:26S proteasome complex subunit SEM1 n=1 Tax=Fusarium venenatum TaxID=56646 RepID=A0A2L2TPG3_9HYPO|nr:uncharacterized protein FVRRES_07026 [Fusarium venenatum]KAG8357240.1 hypothetical protein FVEN_g5124 [Fusarium venenatum]CEI62590.1 unnamed protein product [Fusarium venenatum]
MTSTDPKTTDEKPVEQKPEQKPVALGEDDEFEDFPVDDWPEDQTEAAKGSGETKHLWEESWDDDDTSDDFSQQLRHVNSQYDASSIQQLTVIQGGVEEGRGQTPIDDDTHCATSRAIPVLSSTAIT